MRILLYSYNYAPEPIGIAPLMTELAEGLAARGHKVRVVTGMPNYPERKIYKEYQGKWYCTEFINRVAIQRNYVWIRPNPTLLDRLLLEASFVFTSFTHALKGERPDIVIFTAPPLPVSLPATLIAWVHHCPTVLNLQDILPDAAVHVGILTNKVLIWVFKQLEKFSYRHATKISVIAEGFVDNLRNKNVPAHKLELIPNWVNVDFIQPLPRENNYFRKKYNLEDKFIVLYSGNIALTQGLETVIDTAQYLQDFPDIVLVIVGEESALGKLQEYCDQQGGVDNVRLIPFQPREKLPEMLAAADIGLVVQKTKVVSFNMPSKIQVYLASGLAIIASVPKNGTAAKAITNSGSGLVIPPEDPWALAEAIKTLYIDPEKVTILSHNARNYALEHYSIESALDSYEDLFYRVVKTKCDLKKFKLE